MSRFKSAMEDARLADLTWEQFNLLLTILGTNNNELIEDVLKEAKQNPKNLSEESIKEKWEAQSIMKAEGLDTKGGQSKKQKEGREKWQEHK